MNEEKTKNGNDYLALVAQAKAAAQPRELEMPSGAVWKYIPFSLKQYATAGRLPIHLINKVTLKAQGGEMPEISDEEMNDIGVKNMELARDIFLNNVVYPKISLEPKEGYITIEQIYPPDFEYFAEFIMQGGQASIANSFRSGKATGKRK